MEKEAMTAFEKYHAGKSFDEARRIVGVAAKHMLPASFLEEAADRLIVGPAIQMTVGVASNIAHRIF